MGMTDAEARAVLKDRGHDDYPKRGRLTAEWHSRALHYLDAAPAAGDDYDPGLSAGDFAGDFGDDFGQDGPGPGEVPGDLADDGPGPATGDGPGAGPPQLPAERRPQRPKSSRRPWRERARATTGGAKKKRPVHKRVPVDQLISSAWAAMGGLAGQVDPPLGRCLVMQAPVSGLILEDIVRGTAVDRVLQPVARAEAKAEKVLALAGPPMLVAALEASATLPEQQQRARQAILVPLLERSLVLWARIAGDKLAVQIERAPEDERARQQARQLIEMIWPPEPAPEPGPHHETVGV